jgi:hypothetical protein
MDGNNLTNRPLLAVAGHGRWLSVTLRAGTVTN